MNNKSTSQLCPKCRKLISCSVEACPFCGVKHPASRWKNNIFTRTVSDDSQLVTALITVNVIFFILSILIDPQFGTLNFHPLNFLSPSNQSLLVLGSTGTIPLYQLDRWWTLIAANYLHGGLMHILFNMLAVRQLAPLVIKEFGIYRMTVIYTLGGAGGFFISALAGVQFTIGASAALCSLIGALLYYGKSRGGVYGQAIFSQIGGWALGIGLFGFLIPGINNWGHGGGMVVGLLLGFLLGYRDKRRESYGHKVIAMVCLATTCLILIWSILNGLLFLLF
jgi:rhomboid protease GluP